MLILPAKEDSCTGCGACRAVCPVNAVGWEEDYEGVYRPVINEAKCIHCGKCLQTCPILANDLEHESCIQANLSVYATQAKSRELLQKSSSGGIFGLLGERVITSGGVVCGCVWDDDFKAVHHRIVKTLEELPSLYEAKYLQSYVPVDVYQSIASFLKSGRPLLFCGTPCQICGLDKYLTAYRVDAGDLLLKVALLCHGAPAPGVWRRFVEEEEAKHNGQKVISARFRDKRDFWQNFSQVLCFPDGSESVGNVRERNAFMKFFFGGKKRNFTAFMLYMQL